MKRISLLVLASLALTGCDSISFLYPIYEKQDLANDIDLSGDWIGDGKERWRFTRNSGGPYKLEYLEKNETLTFEANLVRISNQLYLDLATTPEGTAIRGHAVARVAETPDTLQLAWFDFNWLAERLEKDRALAYERPCTGKNKRCYVITASTADLQNFLMRHALDSGAFEKPDLLRRSQAF